MKLGWVSSGAATILLGSQHFLGHISSLVTTVWIYSGDLAGCIQSCKVIFTCLIQIGYRIYPAVSRKK